VAQVLAEQGWKNVHPLYGGFDAWTKAGLPVEVKEQSESGAEQKGSDQATNGHH
jgi:3-mercaptopyruvate sulfurtransferase SseA